MNSCHFVGRLTANPELRRTQDGTAVCSYSLAVKRPMVKDTTDFPEFVSWRQSAEYLAQYAKKGDIVAVCGTLQSREWTDKEGKKRKQWEVVTTSVLLVSSRRDSQATNNTTQPQNSYPGGYSQPQYSQQGYGGYQQPSFQAPGYQAPQGNFSPIEEDDPKLPF